MIDNEKLSITIPYYLLTILASLIIYSWSLFFLLHFLILSLFVMPVLFIAIFISIVLHFVPNVSKEIQTTTKMKHTVIFGSLILTISAPFYSHFYGVQLSNQFIQKLGIEGEVIERETAILHYFGDVGEPRGVEVTFKPIEPQSMVKKKILEKFQDRSGWRITDQGNASCIVSSNNFNETVVAYSPNGGHLYLYIAYHTPYRCKLRGFYAND